MNKNVKIISLILFLASILNAQSETVGVEFNQHARYINSLKTNSNIWLMTYRKELPSGTRLAASLGLDYVKFFENDSTTHPMFQSADQIFVQLEGLQKYNFMYFKGAVQFYSIKGNAVEVTNGNSEVSHNNTYRVFEVPLGAGFTYPSNGFDFYVGFNKVYFFGTNKKKIVVNNGGNETSLGSDRTRTFNADLGLGAEATILYHFSDKLEFEFNFVKYEKEDFSIRFSIWGPLKRMLFTN